MDTKQAVGPAVIIGVVVLLVGLIGFLIFQNFGPRDNGSAPGGAAAKTVAPEVQKFPDGTVVPYPAAPAGATPGDPFSVGR